MAARKIPSAGAKPDKLLRDALMLELNADTVDDEGKKVKKYRRIAANLVKSGLDNKMDAIKEIWDRVEGKATQTIAGDPEAPLFSFDGLRDLLGAKLDRIADERPATEAQNVLN